jgi:hypothetical protein
MSIPLPAENTFEHFGQLQSHYIRMDPLHEKKHELFFRTQRNTPRIIRAIEALDRG